MERRTRAQRRQDARAGGGSARKRRDPIDPVNFGLATLIALVFLGLGTANWVSNHAREQASAFDIATPTPAASPAHQLTIELHDGQCIGLQQGFTRADLAHGISADTALGGHGAPVNGIPCQAEMVDVHVHSHLAFFVHGRQIQIPGAIGMAPTPQGGCLYWLHKHGPDGIIHVEAASPDAPAGGHYTLGMFFDIWGTPLFVLE